MDGLDMTVGFARILLLDLSIAWRISPPAGAAGWRRLSGNGDMANSQPQKSYIIELLYLVSSSQPGIYDVKSSFIICPRQKEQGNNKQKVNRVKISGQ